MTWERLGDPSPDELEPSRLELHYAVQLPGAVGASLLEPREDHVHLALAWDDELRALVTAELSASEPFRVGLRFADLHLFLVTAAGRPVGERGLVGRSLGDGLRWLAGAIADHTGELAPELRLPEHELPEHPLRAGEPFVFRDPDQFEELARWFANANRVLHRVRERHKLASPVRVWPHHFDIATSIRLDADDASEAGRAIGVGMSPGDGSYDEPYLYVTPWPVPEVQGLPDLEAGGRWHVEGWTGAVLIGTRIALADDQERQVQGFLQSAVREAMVLQDAVT